LTHRRSWPCVEARLRATTVISCVEVPVSSRLANVGAHAVAERPGAETVAASRARATTSSFTGLQTTGDASRPARRACRPGAAVLALGFARHGGAAAALVARRLPGRAGPAAASAADLLGLRQPRAHRDADRERARCRAADTRLLAALHRSLPDPPHAPDRRLRRQRRALARRRQHGGVQLPLRRRLAAAALVGARLRPGDRRRPGREPVPRGRPRPPARGPRLPRSLALPARDGRPRRAAGERLRGGRLAVGRSLDRLARLPALLGERRL